MCVGRINGPLGPSLPIRATHSVPKAGLPPARHTRDRPRPPWAASPAASWGTAVSQPMFRHAALRHAAARSRDMRDRPRPSAHARAAPAEPTSAAFCKDRQAGLQATPRRRSASSPAVERLVGGVGVCAAQVPSGAASRAACRARARPARASLTAPGAEGSRESRAKGDAERQFLPS